MNVQDFTPSITFFNFSGDITITWTADQEENILRMVQKKMEEGYTFLIIKPRLFGLFGQKNIPLKKAQDIKASKGLVIPDTVVNDFVKFIDDDDVAGAIKDGKASLASASDEAVSICKAKDAGEVLKNQTVAIRPVVGG